MALYGIDISNWRKNIDLGVVSPRPDFVIMKATGGTGYIDKTCDGFVQKAKQLGMLWGFYHFADDGYGLDPVREAEFFVNNCRNYFGQGIPILDWEPRQAHRTDVALAFLQRVYELTGYRCMIYMNASTENSNDWSKVVAGGFPLWLAGYPSQGRTTLGARTDCPYKLRYWSKPAMWQYTETGRLNGYGTDLDMNVFYGDAKTWQEYVAKPGTPTSAASSDVAVLAAEVLAGLYGNGDARKASLGAKYEAVQAEVNKIIANGYKLSAAGVEALARHVLANKFGVGQERKARLGRLYEQVQARVNQLV